jgi:hypothetical protein
MIKKQRRNFRWLGKAKMGEGGEGGLGGMTTSRGKIETNLFEY